MKQENLKDLFKKWEDEDLGAYIIQAREYVNKAYEKIASKLAKEIDLYEQSATESKKDDKKL